MHHGDMGQWGIVDDSGRHIIFVQPRITYIHEPSIILCSYDPVTKDMEALLDSREVKGVISNGNMELLKHVAVYKESIASPGQLVTRL